MIYFDYCATTPLDERVSALMAAVNEHVFGNPSSVHRAGQEARGYVERARRQLAGAINCEPLEIVFTGSGSEANNLALWNVIFRQRKHVILSAIEHPSVADTVAGLEELGVSHTIIGVDSSGLVKPKDVGQALRDETGLVTVMLANNETGTVEPIQQIGELCQQAGVALHCDAVQALGKIPVDVQSLNVTTMSFSAHKLYGPKGVGALYVKRGTELHPLIIGGGQERRLRAGTENVCAIAGFGLAVEIAAKELRNEASRLEELRHMFLKKLQSELPGVIVNGHPYRHLPGVVSITFPDVDGEALLLNLDLEGFAVSSGSACSSATTKPSRVLRAIGIADELNRRTLRISLGRFTHPSDVDALTQAVVKNVRRLAPTTKQAQEALP